MYVCNLTVITWYARKNNNTNGWVNEWMCVRIFAHGSGVIWSRFYVESQSNWGVINKYIFITYHITLRYLLYAYPVDAIRILEYWEKVNEQRFVCAISIGMNNIIMMLIKRTVFCFQLEYLKKQLEFLQLYSLSININDYFSTIVIFRIPKRTSLTNKIDIYVY